MAALPSLRYPEGQSKLELAPTELINQTFKHFSQKYRQSFHGPQNDDLLEANRSAHRDMRNLCLTSKRVDSVARPLLFENITVSSPAMLIRLYETLVADTRSEAPSEARLQYHIRQISFEILSKKIGLWDLLPLSSSQTQTQNLLMNWDEEFRGSDRAVYDNYCWDQILSSCYFEILRRTPKVRQLVIRMQPTRRSSSLERHMYQPFFRKVRRAVQASHTGEGPKFLPCLTSLKLLGDPNIDDNLFDITVCEPLLRIPTLENITTFRDNGFWTALKPETSGSVEWAAPAFLNVRVAELVQSTIHPDDFGALGVLLQNVEELKISNPNYDWEVRPGFSHRRREPELEKGIAQQALTQMRNLQTLMFDFKYNSIQSYRESAAMSPILASLHKLETVCIPLRMMVRYPQGAGSNQIYDIVDVLPKSLKYLTLRVDMRCRRCLANERSPTLLSRSWPPSSTLLQFMEVLSRLGRDAFPDLTEVVCCYTRRLHPVLPHQAAATSTRNFERTDLVGVEPQFYQRLEQVQASFRQQQIRFSAAYVTVECDICRQRSLQ